MLPRDAVKLFGAHDCMSCPLESLICRNTLANLVQLSFVHLDASHISQPSSEPWAACVKDSNWHPVTC